jgi:hypothetical protein
MPMLADILGKDDLSAAGRRPTRAAGPVARAMSVLMLAGGGEDSAYEGDSAKIVSNVAGRRSILVHVRLDD